MNIKAELEITQAAGGMIGDATRAQWAELLERQGGSLVRSAISKLKVKLQKRQVSVDEVAKHLKHTLKAEPGATKAPDVPIRKPVDTMPAAAAPAAVAPELVADDQVDEPEVATPPPESAAPIAKGITAAVEQITPGRAQAWLLKSQGNRELRKQHIEWLAAQMREGSWEVTGQAVVFAEGGRLLDGHHRLEAVKASGETVAMLVVYGIPPSAWGKIDCGIVRAVHDQLQLLEDVKNNRRAIEILQNLRRIENGNRNKLTPEQIRADWNAIRPQVIAVLAAFPKAITGLTRIPMLAALARYLQRDDVRGLELCEQLRTGANLAETSPALLLRNFLMIDAANFHLGGTTGAEEIYWRTVAACKAHRVNLQLQSLVKATGWGDENQKASA